MERLTKTYSDGTHGASDNLPCGENSYNYKNLLIERLGKYEDLEEQGGLVKLPCKVGDTVYCIENKEIYTCTVGKISISKNNGVWVEINFPKEMPDIIAIEYNPDDFSKTVFLTKSEAEAKLKELKGEDNERFNQ